METQLGFLTVAAVQGDICDRNVAAIVNAANDHLWMGEGVAGAIKRRGGPEIEREAVAKGPIPVGESVATSAGCLHARYILHAAVMGQDLSTDADKIRLATRSALALASDLGLDSVAFPALGTGVGGFPLQQCARIMLQAVREHAEQQTTLARVEFVLFGSEAYEVFARTLQQE